MVHKQKNMDHILNSLTGKQVFKVTDMEFPCHSSFEGNTDLVCNICPEIPAKEGNQIPFLLI